MYGNGQGVAQDYKQEVSWYRKAAQQGYAKAQYNLSLMYARGQGVAQDYVLAYMWVYISAANGEKQAIELRNTIVVLMTLKQIAKAQDMTRDWMAQH